MQCGADGENDHVGEKKKIKKSLYIKTSSSTGRFSGALIRLVMI